MSDVRHHVNVYNRQSLSAHSEDAHLEQARKAPSLPQTTQKHKLDLWLCCFSFLPEYAINAMDSTKANNEKLKAEDAEEAYKLISHAKDCPEELRQLLLDTFNQREGVMTLPNVMSDGPKKMVSIRKMSESVEAQGYRINRLVMGDIVNSGSDNPIKNLQGCPTHVLKELLLINSKHKDAEREYSFRVKDDPKKIALEDMTPYHMAHYVHHKHGHKVAQQTVSKIIKEMTPDRERAARNKERYPEPVINHLLSMHAESPLEPQSYTIPDSNDTKQAIPLRRLTHADMAHIVRTQHGCQITPKIVSEIIADHAPESSLHASAGNLTWLPSRFGSGHTAHPSPELPSLHMSASASTPVSTHGPGSEHSKGKGHLIVPASASSAANVHPHTTVSATHTGADGNTKKPGDAHHPLRRQ